MWIYFYLSKFSILGFPKCLAFQKPGFRNFKLWWEETLLNVGGWSRSICMTCDVSGEGFDWRATQIMLYLWNDTCCHKKKLWKTNFFDPSFDQFFDPKFMIFWSKIGPFFDRKLDRFVTPKVTVLWPQILVIWWPRDLSTLGSARGHIWGHHGPSRTPFWPQKNPPA